MAERRHYRQIVIRYITHIPEQAVKEDNGDAEIDYIYQCLGLGDERDELGRAVFRALVRASRKGTGISSRDIMQLNEVSQAAVIYHLNMYLRSGIVMKDGTKYFLRAPTLEATLDEIENDMHRKFENLRAIAKKADEKGKIVQI